MLFISDTYYTHDESWEDPQHTLNARDTKKKTNIKMDSTLLCVAASLYSYVEIVPPSMNHICTHTFTC